MNSIIFLGAIIPFLGTMLGAAAVFLPIKHMNQNVQKSLLGFAAGVMIAASVWSLLIPAIDMAEQSGGIVPSWLTAAVGFLFGIAFLLLLDTIIPHLHMNSEKAEGRKSSLGKNTMLLLAVTLHNIPEGMAVGVMFAGFLDTEANISLSAAFVLAVGIALQNIPEGAVVSMPLAAKEVSRGKAFAYGILSGAVEPVGTIITVMLAAAIAAVLPYTLAFAAGAMMYVVIEELVPEAQSGEHSNIGTVSAALGFVIMMMLDVGLG